MLLFQSATDGLPRYAVKAIDGSGQELFAYRVYSAEEAEEKRQRLAEEASQLSMAEFLRNNAPKI